MPMFRCVTVVLTSLVVASLFACGNDKKDPPKDAESGPRGTVVLRAANAYERLNPVTTKDAAARKVIRYFTHLPLLELDPDSMELRPWLAESLPVVSPDGLTHTWTIVDGARTDDGRTLTSADVVYSWGMTENKDVASPVQGMIGPVKTVEAIDTRRFRVRYERFMFNAVSKFGLEFGIVAANGPTSAEEFRQVRLPRGYGPYQVTRSDADGVMLDAVEDWWGRRLPRFADLFRIKRFHLRVIDDDKQIIEQVRQGAVDLTFFGNIDEFVAQREAPWVMKDFETAHYYLPNWNFVGWNHRRPMFADPQVRTALSHLVPRDAVNRGFGGGLMRAMSGPFLPGSPCYDENVTPHGLDLVKAKSLLRRAGYADSDGDGILDKNGERLAFDTLWPSNAGWAEPIIRLWKEQLEQVGIAATFQKLEFGTMWTKVTAGDFDAYLVVWGSEPVDPDVYDIFHSSQVPPAGYNVQGYANAAVDRLLEEYRQERDAGKRHRLAHQLHRKLAADQPICFLFNVPSGVLWNRRVKGAVPHTLGMREWDFAVDE